MNDETAHATAEIHALLVAYATRMDAGDFTARTAPVVSLAPWTYRP